MHKTVLNLFKEANYFAYGRLDLELDAREMKLFLSEQYISTQIVLSEEEFVRCELRRSIVLNIEARNIIRRANICPSTVQYLK